MASRDTKNIIITIITIIISLLNPLFMYLLIYLLWVFSDAVVLNKLRSQFGRVH
jgi:hypothetical protein